MTPAAPPPSFAARLEAVAEVLVRVGLNLQRGQRLLLADPYELQGVPPGAEALVEAIRTAARAAGAREVTVQPGDPDRLRALAANKDWAGIVQLTGANAAAMQDHLRHHDALLFLPGSHPRLWAGVPADRIAEAQRLAWEQFGPVAQHLNNGATNWTAAPAPDQEWADAVHPAAPADARLGALWEDLFAIFRVPTAPATPGGSLAEEAIAAWRTHLAGLARARDALQVRRLRTMRYRGPGTDLTVLLPPSHYWCTAQLVTNSGVPFVANLPTEEIFTAPERTSATGTLRVARPVSHGGAVISGIELEFKQGAVVAAAADEGADMLEEILAIDEGARHLGEVALLPPPGPAAAPRPFLHPLLDENSAPHVALGSAYAFSGRPTGRTARNRSRLHLDLPLEGTVDLAS